MEGIQTMLFSKCFWKVTKEGKRWNFPSAWLWKWNAMFGAMLNGSRSFYS